MKRYRVLRSLLIIALIGVCTVCKSANVLDASWSDVIRGNCNDQNASWWSSAEAIRIANNVLLYQKDIGGWPKNENMQKVLSESEKNTLAASQSNNSACTIDNGAVSYELTYLSKVYKAVSDAGVKADVKESFTKGVQYLIEMQYDNGGYPQFYPLRGGYSNHITYNDNAMVNVLEILRHIYQKDNTYSITLDDATVNLAKAVFDKGIECILNTQYIQNGKLSVWCAQHHYSTLVPVMARSYELASLSGAESANILKLLMSIDNPSDEIIRAIYAGAAWYDESRIKGQRLEGFTNTDGESDKRIVFDASAPDMWGRFYTLESNTPFFCDRDGIKKYTIAEIGHERRNGYSWYSNSGFDVINTYNGWLSKWGETSLVAPAPDQAYLTGDTLVVRAYANKHTGKTFQKFELIVDETTYIFNSLIIDTTITGLDTGEHTFVAKAYFDGATEEQTSQVTFELPTYNLSVVKGEGSGEYNEGNNVAIEADPATSGKVFDKWTGDTTYITDIYSANTTLLMPGQDIRVIASYKVGTSITKGDHRTGIEVYPNPFHQTIQVKVEGLNNASLQIYDLNSRLVLNTVLQNNLQAVNVDHLESGFYILNISSSEGHIFHTKMMKK